MKDERRESRKERKERKERKIKEGLVCSKTIWRRRRI